LIGGVLSNFWWNNPKELLVALFLLGLVLDAFSVGTEGRDDFWLVHQEMVLFCVPALC